MKKIFITSVVLFIVAGLLLAACKSQSPNAARPRLVASTTIVGDVVRQVAGSQAEIAVLIPPGTDPHTFEPRPQDISALNEAQVVFINGLDLEEALKPALDANIRGQLVAVSDGVEVLAFGGEHSDEETAEEHAGEEHHEHASGDPHTWMDPNNVMRWAQNIAAALAQADPANASVYQENATAYIAELQKLDDWIRQQVAQIPTGRRKLVTDHASLGYFADEYGFEQVGLVIPAFSTSAAPSAQELAALQDTIRQEHVPAILVDVTVNSTLSAQVAADTGIQVISIYTGSLSAAGGDANSYLTFMRYNVTAIVNALK